MEITKYQSDSGNGDLSSGKGIDVNTPFIEVLQKASEKKAQLIVLTTAFNNNPGAWYIKGPADKYTYDDIKQRIETNVRCGDYSRRTCYLIKYS